MLVSTFAITAVASGRSSDRATFPLLAIPETENVPIERGFTFTDRLESTDGVSIDGWDGGRCINLNPDPEDLASECANWWSIFPRATSLGWPDRLHQSYRR
jgi:hypothetical protein